MDHTLRLEIDDSSQIANARRETLQLLPSLFYDEIERGEISIIVTELVTNILKHARHGEILVNPISHDVSKGIEIIAIDRGPGIPNIASSMRDGFSTVGSSGTGLGAVRRLSRELDIYSVPAKGTAALARYIPEKVKQDASPGLLETSGINVPLRGQEVCGDDWECRTSDGNSVILVVDGLGHGPDAYKAAQMAVTTFQHSPSIMGDELMSDLHFALRSTRGAAASIAWIDTGRRIVRFSGVGNVAGAVANSSSFKKFANANGTIGHVMRKGSEFSYPWDEDQVVIMHSDGIGTSWTLADYPGIISHLPTLIASVIYRDHSRGRDDATVVVSKRVS